MTLAIGGQGVANPSHDPYWVNVTDFGARADSTFDNTAAFQSAVDAVAAKIAATLQPGLRTVGTVFIPGAVQTYMLYKSVWVDSSFIEIRGEGRGTRISSFPQTNHAHFIFGLRRQATVHVNNQTRTLVADSNYRPDLFGKLDATAAPRVGTRWGFRSHGDALIQSQVSPLSVGCRSLRGDFTADNWIETKQLTLEFAVEGPNGGVMPGSMQLFGMGDTSSGTAYPYFVYTTAPNMYQIKFDTQAAAFGDHQSRTFWFSSGSATGVQRITIQIDLVASQVSAYVNGTQATVNGILGPNWGPGLQFAENDYFPMLIADAGGNRPSLGNANGFDFSLYGMLCSRAIRYRNDGAGQPQRRLDNPVNVINDGYRYFTANADDPGMMGYLAFTEDPATNTRLLNVQGGPAVGVHVSSAYLLHAYQSLPGGILDNAIRDVHLMGGHLYGQNIAVGQVIDLKITGVRSTDAYHAIGSLSNGANYTVRLEDCVLDATDSGYFGLDQGLWARNIIFAGAGRATMRFVGCNVHMENLFVTYASPNNQATIKIHAGDYGGNYTFDTLTVDYEGDVYLQSAIYCEAHPYAAATSLKLKDINLGTIGNAALITLRDGLTWFPEAYLSVDNLQAYTNQFRTALDLEGPKWRGEIKGLAIGDAPRVSHTHKYGDGSNVVIRETGFKAPPRKNAWCSGAHSFEVRVPADGQFAEWRCLASGAYGTATPPVWVGLNPMNVSAGSMAGYVLNHAYITATLS